MKRITLVAVVLALLIPGYATAEMKTCPWAQLTAAQTATGESDYAGNAATHMSVVFQYVRNAGTATVQAEICCSDDCTLASGDWFAVLGSQRSIDGTTTTDGYGVSFPQCQYRTNITACSGCNVDTFMGCGAEVR